MSRVLVALLTVCLLAGCQQVEKGALPIADQAPYRVYYEDLDQAYALAASFEPLESDYNKPYLVLVLTPGQYHRLAGDGLRIELLPPDDSILNLFPDVQIQPDASSIPGFPCYRTLAAIHGTAEDLQQAYPDLVEWTPVGESWKKIHDNNGFDLMIMKLTNKKSQTDKPKILISSNMHGQEVATAELTLRLAEHMTRAYGTDADITWTLDYHEVHIMFVVNPDARVISQGPKYVRKNRNDYECPEKYYALGVDLNRNFTYKWGKRSGSSKESCSNLFRGSSKGSEPETKAVIRYIESQFPDQRGKGSSKVSEDATGLYLDIHSSGQLILWPWGYKKGKTRNSTQFQTLGQKFAFFTKYNPQQTYGYEPVSGDSATFAYGELGLAAFIFEIGNRQFQCCKCFNETMLPDNINALLYATRVARAPYLTPAGPDTINVMTSLSSGTRVEITATIDDTRYFTNNRDREPGQTIATAEYNIDVPPWMPGAIGVSMQPVDGNYDHYIESVIGTIDASSLSRGRHTVFIRGKDMNGNWGPVSATFLDVPYATKKSPAKEQHPISVPANETQKPCQCPPQSN